MSVRHVLRALLALGITFGSAWGQKVQIQYDHGADFSQYRTYTWKDRNLLTRQGPEGEKELDQLIVSAANAQLKAKGLVETTSGSPDLYLSYQAGGVLGSHGPGDAGSVLATDAGGPLSAEIAPSEGKSVSLQGSVSTSASAWPGRFSVTLAAPPGFRFCSAGDGIWAATRNWRCCSREGKSGRLIVSHAVSDEP